MEETCPRCGDDLPEPDPQHATYVVSGHVLCSFACYTEATYGPVPLVTERVDHHAA